MGAEIYLGGGPSPYLSPLQSVLIVACLQRVRVVCLIDGDGNIFAPNYLKQCRAGGANAAHELCKHILEYIRGPQTDFPSDISVDISISVFLHKRGLAGVLRDEGYITNYRDFDEFITGFTQSGARHLMIDVGSGKDAADSKLRGILCDASFWSRSMLSTSIGLV